MRNSSLFEGFCADDVSGLKSITEAVAPIRSAGSGGRGAFSSCLSSSESWSWGAMKPWRELRWSGEK